MMKFKLQKYFSSAMNRKVVIMLFLLLSVTVKSVVAQPTEKQILTWFKELKPLPKVHYSFPISLSHVSDEMLFEYTRLSHAISLSGEWGKPEQVDRAVRICKQVNAEKPKIPASLAVNYSVWHRHFGKKLPPTEKGPTHDAELQNLKTKMEMFHSALAAANKKYKTNIAMSAILFDSEHFHTRSDDAAWNKAITEKYDAAYDIVHQIFPKARIEWYARGAVHPGASPTGWSTATYFALDEKGETFGCSLYQVPEIGYTREIFRRTAENAAKHGCNEVTPWISLASGYRRQTDQYHKFSLDWNYDLIYSWLLGREINHAWYGVPERTERFAPWNKAKVAIFYPAPFDSRVPYWAQHFVAYARGAQGNKTLPELPETTAENKTKDKN